MCLKVVILLTFSVFALAVSGQPRQQNEQITVDGITRSFVTWLPGDNGNNKLPVVIALHGRLGTGESMLSFADFRPLAEKDKFIIVCPDGISKSWNDGRATPAAKKGINDVKFIGELITYIVQKYNGDAARVYITGMSNGGMMASRLACELSSRIAAVAVVGASMDSEVDYHPAKPLPVMYIQGTNDPLVPFNGGPMKGAGGEIYSHEAVLTLWAGKAKCDLNPVITNLPVTVNDGTSVIKEEYSNPSTGIKVIGYTLVSGGHTWPGGTQYLPRFMIGKVSHNLDACRVIWEFFKGYKLTD